VSLTVAGEVLVLILFSDHRSVTSVGGMRGGFLDGYNLRSKFLIHDFSDVLHLILPW
jgi:hypothetical protein